MIEENLTERFRKLISANDKIKPKKACETLEVEYNDSTRQLFYQAKNSVKSVKKVKLPKQKVIKKSEISQSNNSSTDDLEHILESIENPVAFASAHIFKKMIETGDVRWAQLYVAVLDKTNKLDYETIKEEQWLRQAKDMSMEEIVNGIAIKGSISRSMSRRLDELDDTSPYENS